MTKDEAIKGLKENLCSLCAYGSQNMDSCDISGCDNRDFIKVLEQQSSEDCVSREFIKIIVEYPPEDLCTYHEYKGKPYFSIEYKENNEDIIGYGTYNLDILSTWLKDYFIQKPVNTTPDDCVSRQAVLETIEDCNSDGLKGIFCSYNDGERFKEYIKKLPPVTPTQCIAAVRFSKEDLRDICNERIEVECKHGTCKDCNWWDSENHIIGYCHACKHGYNSNSWDIGIYRKTKADFYCADFERKKDEQN